MSTINQDRYYFSMVYGMRISFISSIENMTCEYFIKQSKWICELKLNEITARNPKVINCLNSKTCHPLIRIYSDVPFIDDETFYHFSKMSSFSWTVSSNVHYKNEHLNEFTWRLCQLHRPFTSRTCQLCR